MLCPKNIILYAYSFQYWSNLREYNSITRYCSTETSWPVLEFAQIICGITIHLVYCTALIVSMQQGFFQDDGQGVGAIANHGIGKGLYICSPGEI